MEWSIFFIQHHFLISTDYWSTACHWFNPLQFDTSAYHQGCTSYGIHFHSNYSFLAGKNFMTSIWLKTSDLSSFMCGDHFNNLSRDNWHHCFLLQSLRIHSGGKTDCCRDDLLLLWVLMNIWVQIHIVSQRASTTVSAEYHRSSFSWERYKGAC